MKSRRVVCAAFASLIVLGSAVPRPLAAQSTGRGGAGASSRRNAPAIPPAGRRQPDRQPSRPQVVFVSGVVVQEDGSPLPTGVVIERTCGGTVTREAYVDSSGQFSFQVGGTARSTIVLPDASDESGTMADLFGGRGSQLSSSSNAMPRQLTTTLMGCEVRARLAGYTSSRVTLNFNNAAGHVDIGTILLCRMSRMKGTLVSAMDLAAPKPARKAFERFERAYRENNLPEAERHLKSALERYPGYAAAWFGLGQVYQDTGRLEQARSALLMSIEVDRNYVGPYVHLAHLAALEQKWQAAADFSDRAIELDPVDFVDAYFLNAAANYYLSRLDAAERSGRKTVQMDSLHRVPQVHLILADIYHRRHEGAAEIEQLQRYLAVAPESRQAGGVREQLRSLQEPGKMPVAAGQPR